MSETTVDFTWRNGGFFGNLACQFSIHRAVTQPVTGPLPDPAGITFCPRCGDVPDPRWEWVWTTHGYPFSVIWYRSRGPA